jgi:hypothetical protein
MGSSRKMANTIKYKIANVSNTGLNNDEVMGRRTEKNYSSFSSFIYAEQLIETSLK